MVFRHFYLILDCLVKISSDHLVKICTVGLWIGCNLQVNVIKGVPIILLCTIEFLYIYMSFRKLFSADFCVYIYIYTQSLGVLAVNSQNVISSLCFGCHVMGSLWRRSIENVI